MEKKRKFFGSVVFGVKVWFYRSVLFVVNIRVEGSFVGRFLEVGIFFKVGMVVVIGDGLFIFVVIVEVFLNLKMLGKMKFDFKVIFIVGCFGYCFFLVFCLLCNIF